MNLLHQVIDPSQGVLAGPLTIRAQNLIEELIYAAQIGSVLIGIVVVGIVFWKTKSVVPTGVAALVAGLVVWFAFNLDLVGVQIGQEVSDERGQAPEVPAQDLTLQQLPVSPLYPVTGHFNIQLVVKA